MTNKSSWIARTFGWLTERLYRELAWAYDPISFTVSGGKWAGWRNEALAHITGSCILELGFGTGELLTALNRRGFSVIGLESSLAMHRVAARKLRRQGLTCIPRVLGTAQSLPFPAGSFDTVVATFPAGYIFDPKTLSEVKRVLRTHHPDRSTMVGRLIVIGLLAEYHGIISKRWGRGVFCVQSTQKTPHFPPFIEMILIMSTIDCIDLFGNIYQAPQDQIILRPAAYALVLKDGKILLMRMKATGKYHLPGGGIEVGERIAQTLKRELQEETGIEIEVGRLAHFEEVFFYYNPSGRAYHGLHFYYLCRPTGVEILAEQDVHDGSAEKPSWAGIEGLCGGDFQILGETILSICRQYTD